MNEKLMPVSVLLSFVFTIIFFSNSYSENCFFVLENIQVGDSLNLVKEKTVGWEYYGIKTLNDNSLMAIYSKIISDKNVSNLRCVCTWQKTLGVHLDKNMVVDRVDLTIGNTINQKNIIDQCSQVDIDSCIDSGTPYYAKFLKDLIDRYGIPKEENMDNYTKKIWVGSDCSLSFLWSPLYSKAIITQNK